MVLLESILTGTRFGMMVLSAKDIRNVAYHEAAHAVVASALGLAVARVWIGEEVNTGGTDIQKDQDHLPLEDRIAVWAAPIAAKPMFNFEMDPRAEQAEVGWIGLRATTGQSKRQATSERKRCCTSIEPRSTGVVEPPLLDQLLAAVPK